MTRSVVHMVGAGLLAAGALVGRDMAAQQTAPGDGRPPYTAADVHFMQGMIGHHAQAVVMAGWAPSHGASAGLRILCGRIVVSQQDEIASMRRWLGDHHEAMDMQMSGMLMPGMLTAAQMTQLEHATGPEFDQLFLRFMIQHHEGALTMVKELFESQGAAQDEVIFKFASDVNADQTAEIDRMAHMLVALSAPGGAR